jgi:hypothetical protein
MYWNSMVKTERFNKNHCLCFTKSYSASSQTAFKSTALAA